MTAKVRERGNEYWSEEDEDETLDLVDEMAAFNQPFIKGASDENHGLE